MCGTICKATKQTTCKQTEKQRENEKERERGREEENKQAVWYDVLMDGLRDRQTANGTVSRGVLLGGGQTKAAHVPVELV